MIKKDLTGQRFGSLVVLSEHPEPYREPKTGKACRRWICKCDCGKETVVLQNTLTSGDACSCGCLQRERAAASIKEDLTGKRFGRLTVIRRVPLEHKPSNKTANGWLCRCDCGNERVYLTKSLLNDNIKSCGCGVGDASRKRIVEDNVLSFYDGTLISAIRPRKLNKK